MIRCFLVLGFLLGMLRCADDAGGWRTIINQAEALTRGPTANYEVSEGSFALDSDVAVDPQVICQWATARDQQGRPAPRARDVVYYFHQPGNFEFQRDPLFQSLVRSSGFTVCGIRFINSSDFGHFQDQNRFYSYSRSGSFSTIRRAIIRLREELHLPSDPVLLFGYSAGGIGVQRFAEEYPELCGGVATYCGHTFVQKRNARCPFLILHNYSDATDSGVGLESFYRRLGTPVIRLVLPPVWDALERNGIGACHHQNRSWLDRLVMSFFEGVSDLRRGPTGVAWPYVVSSRDLRVIYPSTAPAVEDRLRANDAFPVRVPSTRFYAEMVGIPPEPIELALTDGGRMQVALPAWSQTPKGLVFLLGRGDVSRGEADAGLLLRFGACQGLVMVDAGTAAVVDDDVQRIERLADAGVLPRSAIAIGPLAEVMRRLISLPGVRTAVLFPDPEPDAKAFSTLPWPAGPPGLRVYLMMPGIPSPELLAGLDRARIIVHCLAAEPAGFADANAAMIARFRQAWPVLSGTLPTPVP